MTTIETPEQFREYVRKLLEKELADTIGIDGKYEGDDRVSVDLYDSKIAIVLDAFAPCANLTAVAKGHGRWMYVKATNYVPRLDDDGLFMEFFIEPDPQGSQPDIDI
jgi:hypothetical protein